MFIKPMTPWTAAATCTYLYGMVPRSLRLLCRYWYQQIMVTRAYGYFGDPFKGQSGVTQGNPLSTTISNTVLDTVLRQWVVVVAVVEGTEETSTEIFRRYIQRLASCFCSGNRLLATTQAARLHRAFNVLTELFDRVDMQTNKLKTVDVAFQPCCEVKFHSVEYYGLRMMVEV